MQPPKVTRYLPRATSTRLVCALAEIGRVNNAPAESAIMASENFEQMAPLRNMRVPPSCERPRTTMQLEQSLLQELQLERSSLGSGARRAVWRMCSTITASTETV